MSVLFEHSHRGNVWRLEVANYNGRTFLNWRKWYRQGDTLQPTRDGCTMPLERLPELLEAVTCWLSENHTDEAGKTS